MQTDLLGNLILLSVLKLRAEKNLLVLLSFLLLGKHASAEARNLVLLSLKSLIFFFPTDLQEMHRSSHILFVPQIA